MAQQKHPPMVQAIIEAAEEMNAAINSTKKCFDRFMFVTDQYMKKNEGVPDEPAGLHAVPDDAEPTEDEAPEDAIAAAENALGHKIELN